MDNTSLKYSEGFVFTRTKNEFYQNNSVRIDLKKFSLNSENRRILKKISLTLEVKDLPLENYDWKIGKMAKDFYDKRKAVFTANKIKELLTVPHNFNKLFVYECGYAICYMNSDILHYSYPFHDDSSKDNGMAMMLQAIQYAKEKNLQYIYLGSYNKYKMQFEGVEVYKDGGWRSA